MSANNISSLSALVGIVATAMPVVINNIEATSSVVPIQKYSMYEASRSGCLFLAYPHAEEFYDRTRNAEKKIDTNSRKMQYRFQALKRSFSRYNDGFPVDKQSYFANMADALCKLDFIDNISSYNKSDSSIDTILKLTNGLTLSISCFIDDTKDSPMVFSIHRGKTLLVSDELPVDEIVSTINSVIA